MGESAQNLSELETDSFVTAMVFQAATIASREGLEALTLSRLSTNHGMNRSDILTYFGSIENLRLAVIDYAVNEIEDAVLEPCSELNPGLPRLYGVMCRWLDYLNTASYSGGCFLLSAIPYQMANPGPARERLVHVTREWIDRLCAMCRQAHEQGHLRKGIVTEELVTELHALLYGAHWSRQALDDTEAFILARQAVERRLRSVASPAGIRASKTRRVAHADVIPAL